MKASADSSVSLGITSILDDSAPHNLHPIPTLHASAGSSVPEVESKVVLHHPHVVTMLRCFQRNLFLEDVQTYFVFDVTKHLL